MVLWVAKRAGPGAEHWCDGRDGMQSALEDSCEMGKKSGRELEKDFGFVDIFVQTCDAEVKKIAGLLIERNLDRTGKNRKKEEKDAFRKQKETNPS